MATNYIGSKTASVPRRVLDRISPSWLQYIRQFSITLESIAGSYLGLDHFVPLRKFTFGFSITCDFPGEQLDPRILSPNLEVESYYRATLRTVDFYLNPLGPETVQLLSMPCSLACIT